MSEMLAKAAKAIRDDMGPVFGSPEYLAKPGNVERLEARQQRAAENHARLALLAVLDPDDEDLCNDIGCEIAGGSGDEAEAVEWANITRCVIRELRKSIAQGERTVSEDQGRRD